MKTKVSLLILSLMMGWSSISAARGVSRPDDFVPYPWGNELQFPWNMIQGSWMVKGNYHAYVTFQVVGTNGSSSERQLLIRQYSSSNCELVAVGVGVEYENRTIWAQMKPKQANKAYRLGLRNFSSNNLPKELPSNHGRVMVLSISSLTSVEAKHYPLTKMSNGVSLGRCQPVSHH